MGNRQRRRWEIGENMCLPVRPFKVEREWEHSGLQCAVVLAREASHRCGYVRVPPSHPMFGKDYDAPEVEVHGGLTFAEIEPCIDHSDDQGWWFGFDCAHCGDTLNDPNAKLSEMTTDDGRYAASRGREFSPFRGEHYWSREEVESETNRLAEQFSAQTA